VTPGGGPSTRPPRRVEVQINLVPTGHGMTVYALEVRWRGGERIRRQLAHAFLSVMPTDVEISLPERVGLVVQEMIHDVYGEGE